MRKKPLDRRTFLKGAGVALSLPFLEAMLPFGKSWAAEPMRFVVMYHRYGFGSAEGRQGGVDTLDRQWHPAMLELLKSYENYSTFIRGLSNTGIESNHTEIASFMANEHVNSYKNGTTVDILAARLLNQGCPMVDPLCIGPAIGSSESLLSYMSQNKGARTKVYNDPRELFEMLTKSGRFATGPSTPVPPVGDPARNKLKKDVLSLALGSINSLKRDLGSQDRATLDQTLTAYREAELAIDGADKDIGDMKPSASCSTPELAATYESASEDVKLPVLSKIAALALNCDITRTVSVNLKVNGGMSSEVLAKITELKFPVSSPIDTYHNWSHNRWSVGRVGNGVVKYCEEATRQCNQWNTKHVVRGFLDNLSPGMLDHSAVILASGGKFDAQHPNGGENNAHTNVPFLVIGKLGGTIVPRKLSPLDRTGYEVGNVWLSMLRKMGSNLTTFGRYNPTKVALL